MTTEIKSYWTSLRLKPDRWWHSLHTHEEDAVGCSGRFVEGIYPDLIISDAGSIHQYDFTISFQPAEETNIGFFFLTGNRKPPIMSGLFRLPEAMYADILKNVANSNEFDAEVDLSVWVGPIEARLPPYLLTERGRPEENRFWDRGKSDTLQIVEAGFTFKQRIKASVGPS